MAFIDQVQDLTSLTVSDNDELSQFLKDGVLDVTSRWLAIKPQDVELFARESSETTSNASLNLNGAKIISVVREDGVTSNNWRPCRKISPSQQYLVTDTESLSFASKFNPTYMVGDAGKISVFPAPGADPNAFKVYYVNKDPVNSSGSALIHSHDDILYFPIDKVYLVVIYAGMKLLQANMGATTITDLSVTAVPPDVPTITVSTISFSATAPSYTTPTQTISGTNWSTAYPDEYSALNTALAAIATEVGLAKTEVAEIVTQTDGSSDFATALTAMNTELDKVDDVIGEASTEIDESKNLTAAYNSGQIATALDAIQANIDLANAVLDAPPVPPDSVADTIADFSLSSDFTDAMANAETFFDNEDSEMVASAIQRAQTALQQSLNTFNTDMQKFQASGTGKFSAEVQAYQVEVAAMSAQSQGYLQTAQGYIGEVQAYATASNTFIATGNAYISEAQAYIAQAGGYAQEVSARGGFTSAKSQAVQGYIQTAKGYATEVQALLSQTPMKVSEYQAKLQDALNEFNDDNAEYQAQLQVSIQNAQLEDAEEAKKLQKFASEVQEYQAEVATQIQEYTQNLQADGIGYQWLQDQYAKLKAEYDAAFMIAAPKQQPQQQVRR